MGAGEPTFLWLLPERAVNGFATALGGTRLLTDDERAGLERRSGEGARRRYLGARLLSRYALSACTGRPLDRWRFTRGPHGRPEPQPSADGVRFNLSHCDGLIACVVTRGGPAASTSAPRPPRTGWPPIWRGAWARPSAPGWRAPHPAPAPPWPVSCGC